MFTNMCTSLCLCAFPCVFFAQVMHFAATSRSTTRTRLHSVPQMWTTTAVILPAQSRTARWKAAAASTTTQGGGSTSVAWQTSTALLKIQSRTGGRRRISCGTPGDRTGSLTSSNLSRWRSGGSQPITDREEEAAEEKQRNKDIQSLSFFAQHKSLIKQDGRMFDFHCFTSLQPITCSKLKFSFKDLFIIYTLVHIPK